MYKFIKLLIIFLSIFQLNAQELDSSERLELQHLINSYYHSYDKYVLNNADINYQKELFDASTKLNDKFTGPKGELYKNLAFQKDGILLDIPKLRTKLMYSIGKHYSFAFLDKVSMAVCGYYLYKKMDDITNFFQKDFVIPSLGLVWYLSRAIKIKRKNIDHESGNQNQQSNDVVVKVKENFNSVAGVLEAKEDLKEIVDFLKNPQKFTALGAKVPKGVLLTGEPGNGKTLLARAVAGEVQCPFFITSGSEFIEKWAGVGASRIRELFAQARKMAPCVIFIDELDAIGHKRSSNYDMGDGEHAQTLNQLLTEMDGFEKSDKPILVIGATNNPEVLDKALLRPGRFDRKIEVPYPDLVSREQILRVHIKNIKVDENLDVKALAQITIGFSGAELANLVNEAALNATRLNKKAVDSADFDLAYDREVLGKESKSTKYSKKAKEVTAYHEAGHTLVLLLLPESQNKLSKVTILPRGSSGGATYFVPKNEDPYSTKEEIMMDIKKGLGGRAAEEVQFHTFTQGASSDLSKVTKKIRSFICDYGMSERFGPVLYKTGKYGSKNYSDLTAKEIDDEVKNIIVSCYNEVKKLLLTNKDKLDKLAQALLEKETLQAAEIYKLLDITPQE